ncbi:hypothetical protein SLW70_04550 [Flavobacterium sp. NG2]|uniref:hypothetical protein n=1 Tax=Flavobacterium sp. NG2 TaxID=3097547 RepID=UPI002A82D2A2|nr:hypothetical protein [Flavobacterium sp. NG2]WPR72416.1 hypothetical protein SLW70_04550 [Flavobacterium sp. NG2]
MKKTVFLFLCFALTTILASAQEGPSREPAGAGRAPAGAKSGREGGGGNADRNGKDSKVKDGKNNVSPTAKETAKTIKDANSIDGKGKNMTEAQRNEAARQLSDASTKAAADGKRADAKFYEKERDKVRGKKN